LNNSPNFAIDTLKLRKEDSEKSSIYAIFGVLLPLGSPQIRRKNRLHCLRKAQWKGKRIKIHLASSAHHAAAR